jgi:triphosphatase
LTAYLQSVEFHKLGIELACFAASEAWRLPPTEPPLTLAAFSAAVLQHRWKKLVGAGKRMEELDIAGLHAVRLRAKRARYAAEMFVTLYLGKASQRFIRRLSGLQQHLGVLNDGAVANHLLEELGGTSGRHAYGAGVVAGFMAARAARMRPRIILDFEKFRRQPAYWN